MLNTLFRLFPALLIALCFFGFCPAALARGIPDQIQIKAADVLLSDIEECTKDSLAGQDKWSCVEAKYAELLRMRLEDVNPSAHWCAANSAWKHGDIALTYKRLNEIRVDFPDYSNTKLDNADFKALKTWLSYLDASYAPVKVRLFSKPRPMIVGESSYALTFANRELASTRRFEGYLPIEQYSFGDETLVVTAEGYTLSQPEEEPGARVLRPRPTQDFLDVMALMGPGLRSDSPTDSGGVGFSTVLEGRMTPNWWLNTDPHWTGGYQAWIDVRPGYGTFDPAVSWGLGAMMGRDWNWSTKAGTVNFMLDGGIMLGSGAGGANCQYNPEATSLEDVQMICGIGLFPEYEVGMEHLSGSFHNFYAGVTVRPVIRWNIKNSGVFVGVGAWSIGQMFVTPGSQVESTAQIVLTDGSSVSVPYTWQSRVFFRGEVVPAFVVGGRFP